MTNHCLNERDSFALLRRFPWKPNIELNFVFIHFYFLTLKAPIFSNSFLVQLHLCPLELLKASELWSCGPPVIILRICSAQKASDRQLCDREPYSGRNRRKLSQVGVKMRQWNCEVKCCLSLLVFYKNAKGKKYNKDALFDVCDLSTWSTLMQSYCIWVSSGRLQKAREKQSSSSGRFLWTLSVKVSFVWCWNWGIFSDSKQ